MEWMLMNPKVNTMFSSLGSHIENYFSSDKDTLRSLSEILEQLLREDRISRNFRKAIGFSNVIQKDLLPLLYNIKDNLSNSPSSYDQQVLDTTIRILVNLTVPVECLLPVEVVLKTDTGRNTIFELNWLLTSCKAAFLDPRCTRSIIHYIKIFLNKDEKLSVGDSDSVNNCLLLLRNILHIPEVGNTNASNGVSYQNQIVWNLFTQKIDKILIQLMTDKNRARWGMVMVQLIALMYKDQHVGTLQKLLNLWFESSHSESSEDNESNTSPSDQGSRDSSSSMTTSDPTSDSSDNGGSGLHQHKSHSSNGKSEIETKHTPDSISQTHNLNRMTELLGRKGQTNNRKHSTNIKPSHNKKERSHETIDAYGNVTTENKNHQTLRSACGSETASSSTSSQKMECGSSELSDCGYGTQVENQESISTSSNEDEGPNRCTKPVHHKPIHMIQKSRYTGGKPPLTVQAKKEWRRKKLIKRSRTNTVNMKALLHHIPSDEDISHLLKEFTVDFLLKGYGYLVSDLQAQLLTNMQAHIDTSHFFWLVTYFLKFAVQLELDLENISCVLSFEIVSYLTYEGVKLCEELEVARQQPGSDLTPCLRRMHLVVTAIRELIQAVDIYKKVSHLSQEDKDHLLQLQNTIICTEDLKCLFILLLRHFDPTIQSKQYLQDIIITNHILLIFLENCSNSQKPHTSMTEHIRQFASVDVMRQYGLLLECFEENGEFINNCIFTMMHHVAGDLEQVSILFQPSILKTLSKIWETDFQICDDWSDLIEYVIHKFLKMPRTLPILQDVNKQDSSSPSGNKPNTGWSQDDSDNLYWYYYQSAKSSDPVGKVLSHYTENGVFNKTRIGVIEQLYKQGVITKKQFEEFMHREPVDAISRKTEKEKKSRTEGETLDEINVLTDHLINENKGCFVKWLQNNLLEACYCKLFPTKPDKFIMEPVPYHYTLMKQSIPLVTWSCDQHNIMQYQPFVLLLHKLGFHIASDVTKVFPRIPHFWTTDMLYSVAQKLGPIDTASLKFNTSQLNVSDTKEVISVAEHTKVDVTFSVSHRGQSSSAYIGFTPEPHSLPNWIQVVQQSKTSDARVISCIREDDIEVASMGSDTDLTRMCVSDEESSCTTKQQNKVVLS